MITERLHCIDLDQPTLEGFRKFISCWLYQDENLTFIVDPGPLSTIPVLLEALKKHKVEKLDYILLTHIHIDHAGGTGAVLEVYPETKVICHPKGIKHLIAPEKLWLGSQQVLGKLAEAYGEIIPVPENNIGFEEEIGTTGIRSFLTPGHAQHHCCYMLEDLLFGGEVAGVHYPLAAGVYMRPATPPKFILQVARDSVQKMIDLEPRHLVIAHYGLVEPAASHLGIGRDQLLLWVKATLENSCFIGEEFNRKMVAWLLENDKNFALFSQLEADIQKRESNFLENSFRGMRDYVAELSEVERQKILTTGA